MPMSIPMPLSIDEASNDLASIAMLDVFGCTPHAWQRSILSHLYRMSTKHGDPGPVLLCQPTGVASLWFETYSLHLVLV